MTSGPVSDRMGPLRFVPPSLVFPFALALALSLAASSCGVAPTLRPDPHYVLGKPYQAEHHWYYPDEAFDLDETGLASVLKDGPPRLTSDGEVFDQTALAAAHPTIQLPAIARLTNLENGREVTIRLNDRGSGDPHRLLEVTRRTAQLLGMPADGAARVRLRVLPNESHAADDALPGAPRLSLTTAPRGGFEVAELAPPPGIRQSGRQALPATQMVAAAEFQTPSPPLRLPEIVGQTAARPNRLMVQLDSFDEYHYAAVQRAKMGAAGARIVSVLDGRTRRFRVDVGPLPDIARADAVVDQAFASGIPDARIVVD